MSAFVYIITNIIFPIFALAAAGFFAQKKLKMDSRTFSRINMYILVPAVIFVKIYEADVPLKLFGTIFAYITIVQLSMLVIGEVASRLLKLPKSTRMAFSNSLLFFNSGNYGLPLVDLMFKGNPLAVTGQVFIMLIQNITTSTLGVFQASSSGSDYRKALKNVFAMPSIYALFVVLIVKASGLQVPGPVLVPLKYITGGFVGFALITLGVQLAEIKIGFKLRDMLVSSFIRLAVSPLLGFALIGIFGIKGVLAQSLIIGVSTPTAVNTAIIAREFDNEPDYAAQAVFVSTALSPVTISILIYLMNMAA